MHDFGAMALLRQYSLLNLPTSWKASLISSYGSFLAQQQEFSPSPFHRSLLTSRATSVGGGSTIVPPPPIPPPPSAAVASTAVSPTQPSSAQNANVPAPPIPPIPTPSSATSRKSHTASSARLSPNSNKQRTYPCNECGKVFNAHYNLTRHMPVHTGKFLLT